MNQSVVYVGNDVDEVRYHECALERHSDEMPDFHCCLTLQNLVGQIERVRGQFGAVQMKLCCEASHIGFSLQRELRDRGYACVEVAPSRIPRRAGKSVQTDFIDADGRAEFYANELFAVVAMPDAQLEEDRDLLRSRQQLKQQQGALRRHMSSLLRRDGLHCKAETQRKRFHRKLQALNERLRAMRVQGGTMMLHHFRQHIQGHIRS